jgi:hypothetical protein
MAAIRFQIKVDKSGYIAPPLLTDVQLKDIGNVMVQAQKERWSHGINAQDQKARPLAKVTAKGKATFGKNPIRDMDMTGVVRQNFTLRKWTMSNIRAENTSRAGRMHARKAQIFERMIGISPRDRDIIFAHAYRAYGFYLQSAWRPTNG